MIGGDDLLLEGHPRADDRDFALRWMRAAWRDAIVDSPGIHDGVPVQAEALFPARELREVFVYRDAASRESWTREGLTDANADAVVWITFDGDGVSFVVDDRDSPTGRLVSELIDAMRANRRHFGRAA